jgi:hypothetical protein
LSEPWHSFNLLETDFSESTAPIKFIIRHHLLC